MKTADTPSTNQCNVNYITCSQLLLKEKLVCMFLLCFLLFLSETLEGEGACVAI